MAKRPKKKTPAKKAGVSSNKPRKRTIARKTTVRKPKAPKAAKRAYLKALPLIEQRTDKAGRVYFVSPGKGRVSGETFLKNQFKRAEGKNWQKAYRRYKSEKKSFGKQKAKEERKRKDALPPGSQTISQYYINLDILNVIEENIQSKRKPIVLIYYNRKRNLTGRNLDDFKAILQEFLGDWYRFAEEQYDGSLPYYVELQQTFDSKLRIVAEKIDFNKQAETNQDVLDLAALEDEPKRGKKKGRKKVVDLEFIDIRKYLNEWGF